MPRLTRCSALQVPQAPAISRKGVVNRPAGCGNPAAGATLGCNAPPRDTGGAEGRRRAPRRRADRAGGAGWKPHVFPSCPRGAVSPISAPRRPVPARGGCPWPGRARGRCRRHRRGRAGALPVARPGKRGRRGTAAPTGGQSVQGKGAGGAASGRDPGPVRQAGPAPIWGRSVRGAVPRPGAARGRRHSTVPSRPDFRRAGDRYSPGPAPNPRSGRGCRSR